MSAEDTITLTLRNAGVEVTALNWLDEYFGMREVDNPGAEEAQDALVECPDDLREEIEALLRDLLP